jgi:hypothetical protein
VNIYKTLFFNLKVFLLSVARKLPILFYEKVKFGPLDGRIKIIGIPFFGMVNYSLNFDPIKCSNGSAYFSNGGLTILKEKNFHLAKIVL